MLKWSSPGFNSLEASSPTRGLHLFNSQNAEFYQVIRKAVWNFPLGLYYIMNVDEALESLLLILLDRHKPTRISQKTVHELENATELIVLITVHAYSSSWCLAFRFCSIHQLEELFTQEELSTPVAQSIYNYLNIVHPLATSLNCEDVRWQS